MRRWFMILAPSFLLGAPGCGSEGSGDGDESTGDGDGSTGDGEGDESTGDGHESTGDGDGDESTGDGDESTGDGDGDLSVGNVQSAADSDWGVPSLAIPYTVADDGLLFASVSWYEDRDVQAPTFDGESMIEIAWGETTDPLLWNANGAMYYLPVSAGQEGEVSVVFPASARRANMTVVTVAGASELVDDELQVDDGPPAALTMDFAYDADAASMGITFLSTSAAIDSVVTGDGHVLDSNPTQPLEDFHDGRTYSGHVPLDVGAHAFGFAQDPDYNPPPSTDQHYEAVMILAVVR